MHYSNVVEVLYSWNLVGLCGQMWKGLRNDLDICLSLCVEDGWRCLENVCLSTAALKILILARGLKGKRLKRHDGHWEDPKASQRALPPLAFFAFCEIAVTASSMDRQSSVSAFLCAAECVRWCTSPSIASSRDCGIRRAQAKQRRACVYVRVSGDVWWDLHGPVA